ncbi:putative protein FAM194A-like [Scophthalmus maximus]|uniref:FAM194 C-terminal domain-containing protein n=1 Tax=Scophthalmus maximus TaxID=52904 RepID=A0A2U9BJ77_SCOMX|nr:putative protein FAM194A-like [Scophthalmus maximus]
MMLVRQRCQTKRIPEGRPQSVSDPPTNCVRAAGVLRYNRESDDDNRINLTTVLSAPPPLTEYAVKCEYCGELARPSLDQTWLEEPETATHFCCVERQQLRERLVKWRCLCEGRRDRNSASPTSPENSPTTDAEELLFQGRENEFTGDIRGLGLSLHRSGGQCLDEAGARVRRWSWDSLSLTPTALQPVFLSLNKSVGIRVLGIEQVFVTFLAQGQQAKFSVGTCCAQGESKTHGPTSEPPLTKEDLLASAARIRTHLAIQHLHQCLITPSHPQLPKPTKASHLHAVAQRLLEDSPHVMMSESERAFINKCLQGFSLMPSYNHS